MDGRQCKKNTNKQKTDNKREREDLRQKNISKGEVKSYNHLEIRGRGVRRG